MVTKLSLTPHKIHRTHVGMDIRSCLGQSRETIDRIKVRRRRLQIKNTGAVTIIEADGVASRGSLAFTYKTQTPMTLLERISPLIIIRHIFFHVYLISKNFRFHGQLNKHI